MAGRTARQRYKTAQTAWHNIEKRIDHLVEKQKEYAGVMQDTSEEVAKGLETKAQALREEAQMIGAPMPNLDPEVPGSPGDG